MTTRESRSEDRAARLLRRWLPAALLAALLSPGGARPALAVDDVVFSAVTGHWYKYVNATGNWNAAKAGAEALGGYLACLTSDAEVQWTLANLGMGPNHVWIGGTDSAVEGAWTWVSGETWSWSNWNTMEPNNSGDEDALMMYTSGSVGKWNDAPLTYSPGSWSGYIVEWNADPNPPPVPVIPNPPTNLTASQNVRGSVDLAWVDGSNNEVYFEVQRSVASDPWAPLTNRDANQTTAEDQGVGPSEDYGYRVRAVNGVGPSAWSNEAYVTTGPFVPAPKAPTDLAIVSAGPHALGIHWTDNSVGETGFEVHRSTGGGALAFVASLQADAVSFQDGGLLPDTPYGYAVRSVGTQRASGFVEVAGATTPTLAVAALKGDLKDSAKSGKDSLKVSASFDFLAGASDGLLDPVAEGVTFRLGTDASPLQVKLPPMADGWKGKGAKWKWKSPAVSAAKYKVQWDLDRRTFSVSVKGLQFALPAASPVRVSLLVGDDGGTEVRDWPAGKKAGTFRLR